MFQKVTAKVALTAIVMQLFLPFNLSLTLWQNWLPTVSVSSNETYAASACTVAIENAAFNFFNWGGWGNFWLFNKSGTEPGTNPTPVWSGDITITLANVNFNITNDPENFDVSTVVHNLPNGNDEDGLYTHTFVSAATIPWYNGNLQTSMTLTTGKTGAIQNPTIDWAPLSSLTDEEDAYDIEASDSFCNGVGGSFTVVPTTWGASLAYDFEAETLWSTPTTITVQNGTATVLSHSTEWKWLSTPTANSGNTAIVDLDLKLRDEWY